MKTRHDRPDTRPRRRVRAPVAAALVALLVLPSLPACGYDRAAQRMAPSRHEAAELDRALDPVPETAEREPLYILLMGDDRRAGEDMARSDTLMLARVDLDAQKVMLLSIPRDTRVRIEGHGTQKINAAMAYGGPSLAVDTVKEFTGLPVNHFLRIDFEGLTTVVDQMGGLWIDVDRKIDDRRRRKGGGFVPAIEPGRQKLAGWQALIFVRSRHFPEGDLVRVRHQRQFLAALAKQALNPWNVRRMPDTLEAISDHITTDMSASELVGVGRALKGMPEEAITGYTVPGEGELIGGAWYQIPDEERAQVLFEAMRTGEDPPPEEADPAAQRTSSP